MKFLCPNCKAKYQVGDEKVSGRALKMTCRQCGEPILIRGEGMPRPGVESLRPSAPRPELADGFQQRLSAGPAVESPRTGEQWHVSINDTPVGPMGREELSRKIRMGAVSLDSLAWRDGLDDWLPIRQLPELQALFRSTSTAGFRPPTLSVPSMPAVSAAPSFRAAERAPVSPLGARMAAPQSDMFEPSLRPRPASQPMVPRPMSAPVASSGAFAPASSLPARAVSAPLVPQHGSQAAPALRARIPSQSIPPRQASSSVAQPSPPTPTAVAQQPAVLRQEPAPAQVAVPAPTFAEPAPAPMPVTSAMQPPMATTFGAGQRQTPGWGPMFMLVCGGAFILAVGAFLGAKVFAPAPPPVAPAVQAVPVAPPPAAPVAPALDLEVAAAEEATPVPEVATPKEAAEPVAKQPTRRVKDEALAPKEKTLTAEQREMLARMGGGEGSSSLTAIQGSSKSGSDADEGSGSGEGLDAQQLASVVNNGKRSLQRCYELALRGSGSTDTVRLDVEITVTPSGTVSKVNAKGQSLPGMDQCIHKTVRTWVFPKSGSATTTQFPILFQPGA